MNMFLLLEVLISGFYSDASRGISTKWEKPLPSWMSYIRVASDTGIYWKFFGTGICNGNLIDDNLFSKINFN